MSAQPTHPLAGRVSPRTRSPANTAKTVSRLSRTQRSLRMPVYAHSGGQWLLNAAGLALAGLAVYLYQEIFA
ncbi:MAG: hypothetical protein R6T96_11145, partial [Longimicrobiales bacterium]